MPPHPDLVGLHAHHVGDVGGEGPVGVGRDGVEAQVDPGARREILALLELGGVPTGCHGLSAGGRQEARRRSVLPLRASSAMRAQKSQSSSSVSTALPMT